MINVEIRMMKKLSQTEELSMNVLLRLTSSNGEGFDGIALVPSNLLEEYDLDNLTNDQVAMIFDRLGIDSAVSITEEEQKEAERRIKEKIWPIYDDSVYLSDKDLQKYLDPKPPFRVDRVVIIHNI